MNFKNNSNINGNENNILEDLTDMLIEGFLNEINGKKQGEKDEVMQNGINIKIDDFGKEMLKNIESEIKEDQIDLEISKISELAEKMTNINYLFALNTPEKFEKLFMEFEEKFHKINFEIIDELLENLEYAVSPELVSKIELIREIEKIIPGYIRDMFSENIPSDEYPETENIDDNVDVDVDEDVDEDKQIKKLKLGIDSKNKILDIYIPGYTVVVHNEDFLTDED